MSKLPNTVQRTLKSFSTAPTDGTPFAVPHVYRIFGGELQRLLIYADGTDPLWAPARQAPHWWLAMPPREKPLPEAARVGTAEIREVKNRHREWQWRVLIKDGEQ